MKKRRIFIACSDERLRIGLIMFLDNEPNTIISGLSDNLSGLFAQLEASQSDVLILDWEMPLSKLEDLIVDIHNLADPPEIIFLSSRPEEREKILGSGVDYFCTKNVPPDEILETLNKISGAINT